MAEPERDAPRIVWAVTEGEYSDYQVRALFEREVDAIAARGEGLGDAVAEFVLFGPGVKPRYYHYHRAQVLLWPDGHLTTHFGTDSTEFATYEFDAWEHVDGGVAPRRPRVRFEPSVYPRPHAALFVVAEAMTQEAAVKALSDAVAKKRAEILEAEQAKPKPGQKPGRSRG